MGRSRCPLESCSTPRGITAPGHICQTTIAGLMPSVLNASRHHRPGSQREGEPEAAQAGVLNASRHHRPGSPSPACGCRAFPRCAQRLAASPPRVTLMPGASCGVILRAQRLAASPPRVTTAKARSTSRSCSVLNASRHHRPGSPRPAQTPGPRALFSPPITHLSRPRILPPSNLRAAAHEPHQSPRTAAIHASLLVTDPREHLDSPLRDPHREPCRARRAEVRENIRPGSQVHPR